MRKLLINIFWLVVGVLILLLGSIIVPLGIIGGVNYILASSEDTVLLGRDVLVTFWNEKGYFSRFGDQYLFIDANLERARLPYLVDYYYIKEKNNHECIYIICKDNMMVFDNNRHCVVFFTANNLESALLIKHMKKYYALEVENIVDNVDKLGPIEKNIYFTKP
ncbi:hypothetical protein [Veillonella agrestimuris]|uniref:hypothetical protein n=1 Tax=Veillonella agrestimuris TaxID=2941340 RepID=UPI00203F9BF5|nr:hypothetical protein [Veillonella agrestimuris]